MQSTNIHPQIYIYIPADVVTFAFVRRTPAAKALFAFEGIFSDHLIRRGSWDKRLIHFTEHPTYRLLLAFNNVAFDPKQCVEPLQEYYRIQGRSESIAIQKAKTNVSNYVESYKVLANNMLTQGYKPWVAKDEIGIAIGRDGSFIKVANGNHRLALAKILGIKTVVAEVRFVHSKWIDQRTKSTHASLRDIITTGLRENGCNSFVRKSQ